MPDLYTTGGVKVPATDVPGSNTLNLTPGGTDAKVLIQKCELPSIFCMLLLSF
jgi:hypothetical protein